MAKYPAPTVTGNETDQPEEEGATTGCININTATLEELKAIIHISDARAQANH